MAKKKKLRTEKDVRVEVSDTAPELKFKVEKTQSLTFSIRTDFILNFRFWAIIPSLNLNLKDKRVEVKFLCFSIESYII